MLTNLFPLLSASLAIVSAQLVKPPFHYLFEHEWDLGKVFDSGGFPSSHTAMVTAVTIAIGIVEGIDSSIFAVILVFSLIVCYDAANVRYYAGKNIQITQQLIKDIQDLTQTQLNDPIYLTKIKDILGHKWIEVFGGILWGALTAGLCYLFLY